MDSIRTIIQRLGYEKSDGLFYASELSRCSLLSWHDKRVLKELLPYAVYIVDGKVFVAFFNDLHLRENSEIQCKIWNAQIPVIISDEGELVKIYNGRSMQLGDARKVLLSHIGDYEIEQFDETCSFSYWNVTNADLTGEKRENSDRTYFNDYLVDNLKFLTQQLKERYHITFANKFVLRIIFIRYLIDRGIDIGYGGLNGNRENSRRIFLEIIRNKNELFALFAYLKNRFNGNLFEMEEAKEREEMKEAALFLVHVFLTGQMEARTGQLWLFPFYDFNIIPIELISNIYEILLGREKQNKDKAFYTPEYLADFMVEQTVGAYLIKERECTVLDPACGSGIFLVKALRKILEKNASENGFLDRDEINRLVEANIYGVDYNEEAIDVTIFSLYITLFDYQDPKSLKDFKLPLLKGKNIFYGDFFDEDTLEPMNGIKFKFVIGNPPWGSVQQNLYKEYCKKRGVKLQNGEISVAFLLKTWEMGGADTECSLIIPSKILYKGKAPSCDFRKKMLTEVEMRQVLELSAVRKQIFKGAVAPAAVLSFVCKKALYEHKVEYISLKPNEYLRRFGIIMVEPDDIKYVEQSSLLQYDELWKILVYGGYWDFELLHSMKRKLQTIRDIEKKYGLMPGEGIQDHYGDGQDASHLTGRILLDSDGCIEHFKLNTEHLEVFQKERIHRPRKKELFEPPYVFFKKGLDCSNYSIKAVYSEKRLVYKETVNCIKGTFADKGVLLNLAGLFNSSLFSYFNLMLGSSVGIEREQMFSTELENFPYVYSEELVMLVQKLQEAAEAGNDITDWKEKLDQCVLEMYGVQDNYFVDYALKIQIPILCGKYRKTKCKEEILKKYAQVFMELWQARLERTGLYYSIYLYPDIKGKFTAFQMKLSFEKLDKEIHVVETIDDDVELLTKFMIYKWNDCFFQTKNVVEFDEDSFVIVKTADSKNWHPAMAIKDSYKALNTVLLGEEDWK